MKLHKLSVSAVESWRACELKLALSLNHREELRGEEAQANKSEALRYGSWIHEYAMGAAADLGAIVCGLRDDGDPSYNPRGDYYARAEQDTRWVHQVLTELGVNSNTLVESECSMPISCSVNGTEQLMLFHGYIDLLHLWADGAGYHATMLDWKTTKVSKYRKLASQSLQLRCYAAALRACHEPKLVSIDCCLAFFQGQELSTATFDDAVLDHTVQELKEAAELILACEDPQPTPNWQCAGCDVRQWCPSFSQMERSSCY